jgi:type VI secretion system protein ImpA
MDAIVEADSVEFDDEFVRIESSICEYDSVGNAPQRKGEGAFQWNTIESTCLVLLNKAKDIRVAIWYMRACLARRGLGGLAEGVKLLAGIVGLPAGQIHPLSLPDESPGERHAIHLGWLGGSHFLHQLGAARFEDQGVTLIDLAQGNGSLPVDDRLVRAAANVVLRDIRQAFQGIEEAMLAAGHSLDLSRVVELLDNAISRLTDVGSESVDEVPDLLTQRASARPLAVGTLKTREEVRIALERVAEYFRVHEPSHPAPIFLSRIQRMLGAGFDDVMAELYPEAVALVAQLDRPQRAG